MDVRIEPLQSADFALAAKWLSTPEISRWLYAEWRERRADERLIAIVAMNRRNRLYLVRSGDAPVGLAALGEINHIDRSGLIWYLLGEPQNGRRGIVTDAIRQLVRVAFSELGLRSLSASILESNASSRRVLEKNGFREAGVLRRAFHLDGSFVDRIVFDLLPEDLR